MWHAGFTDLQAVVIEMNRSIPATGNATFHFCPSGVSKFNHFRPWLSTQSPNLKLFSNGVGLVWQTRRRRGQNGLKYVVAAELSGPLSLNLGLDSQDFMTLDSLDVSELRWIGPIPGDIAEVEAYCRIFRAAESLHSKLMDTLCDPVTGECTVSYESSSLEESLLEDKIVSVLGCMVSLLNKGRQDVLSGRSSIMVSSLATKLKTSEDRLPPLAIFRGEIKRCCESLHVALDNILTPDDDRSCVVWRKLQRLKNICYDLGFPRGDGSPEPALLANWAPVYISTSKEDVKPVDSEVAFWKGGQLMVDGFKYLMERGFKTVVDLRDEIVKDSFYHSSLKDAIESGKVELIKLPVEIGMAPSMEQVEKFASLVSDRNRRPIYLHSREGVWRTSAMISRWRQYVARFEQKIYPGINSKAYSPQFTNGSSLLLQNDTDRKSVDQRTNGTCNGSINGQAAPLDEVTRMHINPLKAQVPPKNVLSRKTMSRFIKRRSVSPPLNHQTRLLPMTVPSEAPQIEDISSENVNTNVGSGTLEVGTSDGLSLSGNMVNEPQKASFNNVVTQGYRSDLSSDKIVDKFGDTENFSMTNNGTVSVDSSNVGNGKIPDATKQDTPKNIGMPVLGENGVEILGGDMCASATGVVRVQSRRKAEMFLVRTDGFSCTREKVTESSLAFTHPSTQQQMLLWKSTPKTVLLLKKLGKVLIEEAKEAAYFLYHEEKMNILVEPEVHDMFARIPGFGFVQTFYSQDTSDLHEKVDFVACLGGDGVILHASNLFKGPVPPVVSLVSALLAFSHPMWTLEKSSMEITAGMVFI